MVITTQPKYKEYLSLIFTFETYGNGLVRTKNWL